MNNKPIYDLIQETPLQIVVRDPEDRHILGTIQQTGTHQFRAHGSYFDCTFSSAEYAKACFHREQKAEHQPTVDNQLTLTI